MYSQIRVWLNRNPEQREEQNVRQRAMAAKTVDLANRQRLMGSRKSYSL